MQHSGAVPIDGFIRSLLLLFETVTSVVLEYVVILSTVSTLAHT